MKPLARTLMTLLVPLVLTACGSKPEPKTPTLPVPEEFQESREWKPAAPAPLEVRTDWWQGLGDPELDRLEQSLEIGNSNILVAASQYRAARATLESAQQALLPTANLSASQTRSASGATSGGKKSTVTTTSYNLLGSVGWEVDLWGRLKHGVAGAEAKYQASGEDLTAARLSAQTLLAQVYLQLRASDRHLALLKRQERNGRRFLDLTRDRHAGGVASALDVAQAETQLQTILTQSTEMALQRAQLTHNLATLTGRQAITLAPLPENAPLPPIPPVPTLIPSWVLEHRPDIAGAERRVAAAKAQIGLAEAAFFPVLNLGGDGGYRGSALGQLIQLPNRIWSLGPSLALSVLDSGQRSNAFEQARAAHEQAVVQYRQTVLTAFGEVEDNLAALRLLEEEAGAQAKALEAARRAREIGEHQYRAGTTSSLTVVTALNSELAAERSAIDIHNRRVLAALQLLKNCGGGLPDPARSTRQN
ncbi:MAG: efflux transporter outer membrane subunit [Magnetococcales bacterium]|nr:efflux transporter outer membrane subunit [Magnetococcales bacterium]